MRDGHVSHATYWRQLFPAWEYVIPCVETKCSLTGNCSRLAKEKLVFFWFFAHLIVPLSPIMTVCDEESNDMDAAPDVDDGVGSEE